jgi:hypothetical protein
MLSLQPALARDVVGVIIGGDLDVLGQYAQLSSVARASLQLQPGIRVCMDNVIDFVNMNRGNTSTGERPAGDSSISAARARGRRAALCRDGAATDAAHRPRESARDTPGNRRLRRLAGRAGLADHPLLRRYDVQPVDPLNLWVAAV